MSASPLSQLTVAVLGLGTLGRALVKGLTRQGELAPERVRATVRRESVAAELSTQLGLSVGIDNAAAVDGADVVLICTKPKGVAGVLQQISAGGSLAPDALVVSVAAGVTTAAMEAELPAGQRVVRAMPNTPCLIGEGMTVVCPGSAARSTDAALAMDLFRPLGRVLELDEEHIDVVTGLSGSGPAFVYVILEALSEGGVMMGLPRKVATELACQTVRGAATMVLDTGRHPAELKDEVLTPAGCTIAGLLTMEDGGIRSTLARGIQEAARAAAGLGGSKPDLP